MIFYKGKKFYATNCRNAYSILLLSLLLCIERQNSFQEIFDQGLTKCINLNILNIIFIIP